MSDLPNEAGHDSPSRPERDRPGIVPVAIVVLGAAFFVILFFGWNALCLKLGGRPVCRAGFGIVSGWSGFGEVAGLAAVCLVLWEALSVTGALVLPGRAIERQVAAGLAAALAAFALLRVLTRTSGLTGYAWLGLGLAAAVCAVAVIRWLRCRRPGVSQGQFASRR
jgi:hypothetical protein